MTKFLKRVFCPHLNWVKGRPLSQTPHFDDYRYVGWKGFMIPWTCTKCGKTKQFAERNPPIQYLGDT